LFTARKRIARRDPISNDRPYPLSDFDMYE